MWGIHLFMWGINHYFTYYILTIFIFVDFSSSDVIVALNHDISCDKVKALESDDDEAHNI